MMQDKKIKKPVAPKSGRKLKTMPGTQTEETCRCKEVAEKSPLELVKTMLDDLALWKKKGSKKS